MPAERGRDRPGCSSPLDLPASAITAVHRCQLMTALHEKGTARKSDSDPELAGTRENTAPAPAPSLGCGVGFT